MKHLEKNWRWKMTKLTDYLLISDFGSVNPDNLNKYNINLN